MIKIFTVHTWYATNKQNLDEHDNKINQALEFLQQNDCSYVSHNTSSFEKILRTEIVYKENIVRKVLFEKHKNATL
jgi:hypothetical protein